MGRRSATARRSNVRQVSEMSWQEILLRLAVAAGAGMAIGLEREWREKSAGLRTQTLVSIGSAAFILAGISYLPAEGVRIMAGVATGVGFLGAGTIIRSHGDVLGLTTAASVWMAAALGSAAALGMYGLTGIGTALTLVVLFVLSYIPMSAIQKDTRVYELGFAAGTSVGSALDSALLERAGLSADIRRLEVREDSVVASWIARGGKRAHEQAYESLAEEPAIVWFTSDN